MVDRQLGGDPATLGRHRLGQRLDPAGVVRLRRLADRPLAGHGCTVARLVPVGQPRSAVPLAVTAPQ